jgi:hypothetical protein
VSTEKFNVTILYENMGQINTVTVKYYCLLKIHLNCNMNVLTDSALEQFQFFRLPRDVLNCLGKTVNSFDA